MDQPNIMQFRVLSDTAVCLKPIFHDIEAAVVSAGLSTVQ